MAYRRRSGQLLRRVDRFEHRWPIARTEDGYAVAGSLDRHLNDFALGLQEYYLARTKRTARVQLLALARAVENPLTSLIARLKRDIPYAMQRFASPEKHTYKVEWIYGHDVTA